MTEDEHPSPSEGSSGNITGEEIIIPAEGDLRRFFEILRSGGKVTVTDGKDRFSVHISPSQVSDKARAFLTRGGPVPTD
ncbi:hypothetical protein EXN32_07885 [Agrobacterium tumefaciens]|uniref:hypothetical protein n=1 Tax=Agrobacterium TaxID=357 RepID=UPI00115F5587|nr:MULTISPECIES: hypothetical protein [Agrobacterium]MDA5245327.1 hypothetical protein [Agrobacterium sp. MAFF310724]MDA5246244.1 hypothetical protein [Agrobacterium sp. MAFF210268]TRB17638.1 hypothetical protein EXN32_07885 [Agrobacterium tumefaciens]